MNMFIKVSGFVGSSTLFDGTEKKKVRSDCLFKIISQPLIASNLRNFTLDKTKAVQRISQNPILKTIEIAIFERNLTTDELKAQNHVAYYELVRCSASKSENSQLTQCFA